jgi:uncharacterized protein
MKCPVCSRKLKELRVDDITVDVCDSGCGGIWFDAFELQRVDEVQETTGAKLVDTLSSSSAVTDAPPDKDAKRECPRCAGIKLKKHFFSAKRRVAVDQCPNCGGYWLDHGELQVIRAETEERSHEEAQPKEMSMETIRMLYRMKLKGREPGTQDRQS